MITYRTRQRCASALALTDEHALLLGQVAARAEDVVAVAARDRWPRRQLQALLDYVRAEVLQQVADEERLLFPARQGPGFARLRHEHMRVRRVADALAEAAHDEAGWTTSRLAAVSQDLVTTLERHLAAEDALLTTPRTHHPAPATAVLTGRSHEWYPLTEGTVIDLDALPAGQAIDAAAERLLRLRAGEHVELRASHDLMDVWRRMDRSDPGGYGFVQLQEGPRRWAMRVTRRHAT